MLAPIVTKDMKLFPTRPIPKHNIKNVRSRAQSLNDFGAPQRSRVVPVRQRNSLSVGHLPQHQQQQQQPVARSPPKHTSLRKPSTLGAIVEDVELASDDPTSTHISDPHIDRDELMVPSSPTTSSAPSLDKPKKSGFFRKWLSKKIRSRSSSVDDMDADCAAADAEDDDNDSEMKGTKRKVSTGSADEHQTHRSCPDSRDPKAKHNASS